MEQTTVEQAYTKRIQQYLWLNILTFVMSILGPMFFWVGLPPFILSLMGIIYSRQAMVFEKTGETKNSILYAELAANYARFSLWWIITVYIVGFIVLMMIKATMPDSEVNILEFMTPMHGKLSSIMSMSGDGKVITEMVTNLQ